MGYVLGIDEAGLGPNLGPLVVAASVWKVPDELGAAEMYEALSDLVTSSPQRDDRRLSVADSKQLYGSNKDLRLLERGVLTLMQLLGQTPERWGDAWQYLVVEPCEEWRRSPWHVEFDEALPVAAASSDIVAMAKRLDQGLAVLNVELLALRAVAVFPGKFNELAYEPGTKGVVLSRVSIGLLGDLLEALPASHVEVVCDKHGGRNAYGHLLQERLADRWIEVRRESKELSEYRWGGEACRVETRFCTKAERFFPTAVASMVAKYLRELSMRAFNQFWCARIPQLKPTAGYPVDAKRFRRQIAVVQAALGIEDRLLWRER